MGRRKPKPEDSREVQVMDAPAPIGYCLARNVHAYANRDDAAFAGAVNLRGLSAGQAVKIVPCQEHFHYLNVNAVKV